MKLNEVKAESLNKLTDQLNEITYNCKTCVILWETYTRTIEERTIGMNTLPTAIHRVLVAKNINKPENTKEERLRDTRKIK